MLTDAAGVHDCELKLTPVSHFFVGMNEHLCGLMYSDADISFTVLRVRRVSDKR